MSEPTPPAAASPSPDPVSEAATGPGSEPTAERPQAPVPVRLRRAPRYRVFIVAGALVGVVVGALASLLLGAPGSLFSLRTVTGYLATIGLLLGGLLGGAVAVLVDRPRR